MTTSTTVEATTYYEQRRLPVPADEIRAGDRPSLCEAIDELDAAGTPWRIFGDGQHARTPPDGGDWTAIRTEELDDIIALDQKSGLVHVEAGVRWRALEGALRAEGFSLQRYGLQPASATVGGMLARRRPGPPQLRGGELLDGCVAIGAHSPVEGEYRYLVAPRKASGPDLRHEFIGTGGRRGAILDATLVVWRPVAQRLLRYRDCTLQRAARIMDALFDAGITPSWLHYGHRGQSLQLALTAPGQLLRSRVQWLADQVGAADETGDAEATRTRRQWLEARHPDRRGHPDAEHTRVFWLTEAALQRDPAALFGADFDDLEIVHWTPRRIEAFVRYEPPLADADTATPAGRACWAHWPLVSP